MPIYGICYRVLSSMDYFTIHYLHLYTMSELNLEDKSIKFTNNIISIAVTLSPSAVLGIIFSSQIVNLAAPGFEGKVYELTISLLSISVISYI